VPGTPPDPPLPRSARAPRAPARLPPDRGSPPARAAGPRTADRPARRCQTRAAAGPPTASAAGDCGDGYRGVAPADGRGRGVLLAGDVRPQPLTSPSSPRCPPPQPDSPHHRPHRGGSQRQRLPSCRRRSASSARTRSGRPAVRPAAIRSPPGARRNGTAPPGARDRAAPPRCWRAARSSSTHFPALCSARSTRARMRCTSSCTSGGRSRGAGGRVSTVGPGT